MSSNIYAAIDLGSNSFRIETSTLNGNKFEKLNYLKSPVRIGGGLDENGYLSAEIVEKGLNCLSEFAQIIGGIPQNQIVAVATQTFREAKNAKEFITKGENILRCPIEIISGKEEARLIYLGADLFINIPDEYLNDNRINNRLVIDIGGRSTELIFGVGGEPQFYESVPVGSVNVSMKFFRDGLFLPETFNQAIESVSENILSAMQQMNIDPSHLTPDLAIYGTSGTIGAVIDILSANKIDKGKLTWGGLQWIYQKLLLAQNTNNLINDSPIKGLQENRIAVIGGGLSILLAILKVLNIHQIKRVNGGLRHGILRKLIV